MLEISLSGQSYLKDSLFKINSTARLKPKRIYTQLINGEKMSVLRKRFRDYPL